MKTSLKVDHRLFEELEANPPVWWKNLKNDKDLYIDIRKDNKINVYYNGGSIMKLEWVGGPKGRLQAKIHFEYIPLQGDASYVQYDISGGNISLPNPGILAVDNFSKKSRTAVKKRVGKFFSNSSEKGLQGHYVTRNYGMDKPQGFFLDTEFQHGDLRIDLVWIDLARKKLAFVELKTISDARLNTESKSSAETIDQQIRKYYRFIKANRKDLQIYYDKVFQVKKQLGLLPSWVTTSSLNGFDLIEKPVLLVGDCTLKWIKANKTTLNQAIEKVAFGCVYQGPGTFRFGLPYRTVKNSFKLP